MNCRADTLGIAERADGDLDSRFVGGGDVGLWDKLSESDSSEDEERARSGANAEALAGNEKRGDPGEDGLEGEQKRGVG